MRALGIPLHADPGFRLTLAPAPCAPFAPANALDPRGVTAAQALHLALVAGVERYVALATAGSPLTHDNGGEVAHVG